RGRPSAVADLLRPAGRAEPDEPVLRAAQGYGRPVQGTEPEGPQSLPGPGHGPGGEPQAGLDAGRDRREDRTVGPGRPGHQDDRVVGLRRTDNRNADDADATPWIRRRASTGSQDRAEFAF